MKSFLLLILAVAVIAPPVHAASRKRGARHQDVFDAVTVEQTTGNRVSRAIFERTIVALNVRRETRAAPAVTNQTVTYLTNLTVTAVTNQTVTVVTNASRTVATNQLAAPWPAGGATNELSGAETNQLVTLTPPSSVTTNVSLTTSENSTLSRAANQIVTTANHQTMFSRQITASSNNLSITTADNVVISAETNQAVTFVTNQIVTAVTNVAIALPGQPWREYFLYTEFTPPPEFTLAGGESLVLLVDGVRHGFTATNSNTAFIARKGFTSHLYKVSPEQLVDIANAGEVKIRLKGTTSVIERQMNAGSRNTFKQFLLKYLVPDPAPAGTEPNNDQPKPAPPVS